MARKGRELEKVVAILEDGLCDSGIKVTSPDWLVDKDTGKKREVDISLKGTVGSHDIVVIVECRDRKSPGDVTWIEQLKSKKEGVGANKAVAVSSSGFTSGAIQKAKDSYIELRTLESINPKEIWFKGVEFQTIQHEFVHLYIGLKNEGIENPKSPPEFPTGCSLNDTIFHVSQNGDKLSLNQIWDRIPFEAFDEIDIPQDGKKVRNSLKMRFKGNDLLFETLNGLKLVQELIIEVNLWIECEELSPMEYKAYKNEEGVIAEYLDYEIEIGSKKYSIGIQKNEGQELQYISFYPKSD